ncbi:membrane autotransporter barrel domain protein [Moniliophthora roreri MCA 2997]|uniref:Membrane autotransporter barrel domain protein n=1 Tax=Moniliophthora roreri (strain MCA 2997) TaxID=1381753 RepID=V2XJ06_MONRO|nr:membrane autotransporter barrel domain protein [Moniliophthora roreri MCA 2997]
MGLLYNLRLLAITAAIVCLPLSSSSPLASRDVSVKLDGVTYVNKGLVAFGLIPSDLKESTGDTLGGFGSAIGFKRGTWKKGSNGTFVGTLVACPDRGYNVETPIDYQSRRHEIDFVLTPYYGSKNLDFLTAQTTLQLTYKNTTLMFERNNTKTTGLDALAVRAAQNGFPQVVDADPVMPIPSDDFNRLTLDVEGLVLAPDGSYWISDEYGPYIYRFGADGHLIQTIQPPEAFLPKDKHGALTFTSLEDPATGRVANSGFEGLTLDHDNKVLYAMLQAATIQDGGDDKATSSYTRLVAYDVSDDTKRPALVGEWVVPLPRSNSKGNTRKCSEIFFVSKNIFLALSRDGDGRGGDEVESKYKQADIFSIAKATDIHGTKFDDPSNPVAPKGTLDKSITPATYISFVDYIDEDQLARFGLHNGGDDDETLIVGKWESLALAPAGDPAFPNDYFLFTAADNDFLSTHGVSLGIPFDAGKDVDNQMFVFRLTLPSVKPGSVECALGIK